MKFYISTIIKSKGNYPGCCLKRSNRLARSIYKSAKISIILESKEKAVQHRNVATEVEAPICSCLEFISLSDVVSGDLKSEVQHLPELRYP